MANRKVGLGQTYNNLKALQDAGDLQNNDIILIYSDITETADSSFTETEVTLQPVGDTRYTIDMDGHSLTFASGWTIQDLKFINIIYLQSQNTAPISNVSIRRNIIITASNMAPLGKGVVELFPGNGNALTNITVENNYIKYTSSNGDFILIHIYTALVTSTNIYVNNNTLVSDSPVGCGVAFITFQAGGPGAEFQDIVSVNNIFVNLSSYIVFYGIYAYDEGMSNGGIIKKGYNTVYGKVLDYKKDAVFSWIDLGNDITEDPRLIQDYKIYTTSPCHNTGIGHSQEATVPTDDIDGNSRATDMGCFESSLVPTGTWSIVYNFQEEVQLYRLHWTALSGSVTAHFRMARTKDALTYAGWVKALNNVDASFNKGYWCQIQLTLIGAEVSSFKACYNAYNHLEKYTLNACPKCLGTGYVWDLAWDRLGYTEKIKQSSKLQQELEKIILSKLFRNPYHMSYGTRIKYYIFNAVPDTAATQLRSDIVAAISRLQFLQDEEVGSLKTIPDTERISKIAYVDTQFSKTEPRQLSIRVGVVTMSGELITANTEISKRLSGSKSKSMSIYPAGY